MTQQYINILYLSINSSYSHSSLAYGQLRAFSEKKKKKIRWNKIEATVNDNQTELLNKVLEINPSIIISTLYIFNHNYTVSLTKKISILKPDIKIIMGGPEFLGNNYSFLKNNSHIICAIRGDETSLPDLLDNIYNTAKWTSISGICFIDKNNNYIDNGTSSYTGTLDNLPSPYTKHYYEPDKPFLHFETTRGCNSKCAFCSSSLSKGIKTYSLERIKSDLNILKDSGIKEIRILDRTFNIPVSRSIELLNTFYTSFNKMRFHLEIDPSKLNDELIKTISLAPDKQLHIEAGIQTFNETVLKNSSRFASSETIIANLQKLCSLTNIKIHTDLIAGLPKQTYMDIYNDLCTLAQIGPAEIQLELLKILPGSTFEQTGKKQLKWSPVTPYEILETDTFSLTELAETSCLSKMIDTYYNVQATRNIFRYAIMTDEKFLLELLHKNYSSFSRPDKPAPAKRYKMLIDYAKETGNNPLYEVILFACFMNGIFDTSLANLSLLKKDELNQILSGNNITPLWNNDQKTIDKPAYLATFNHNAFEIWAAPHNKLKSEQHKYLFRLSCAGMSKKVSRVDLIR